MIMMSDHGDPHNVTRKVLADAQSAAGAAQGAAERLDEGFERLLGCCWFSWFMSAELKHF